MVHLLQFHIKVKKLDITGINTCKQLAYKTCDLNKMQMMTIFIVNQTVYYFLFGDLTIYPNDLFIICWLIFCLPLLYCSNQTLVLDAYIYFCLNTAMLCCHPQSISFSVLPNKSSMLPVLQPSTLISSVTCLMCCYVTLVSLCEYSAVITLPVTSFFPWINNKDWQHNPH